MGTLRWFAGGQERRERAIFLINQTNQGAGSTVNSGIKHATGKFDSKNANPLYQVLDSYRTELKFDGTSTPYILNRMNIDISKVLLNNNIRLSSTESSQLKELRALSHIRII
mgnify:CR=1 FL=1